MTKPPRKPPAAPPPPRPKVPRVPPPPAAGKKRAGTKSREEAKDGRDGRDGREASRPRPPAKPRAVSEIEVELDLDGIELDEDEVDEVKPEAAQPEAAQPEAIRPDPTRLSGPRLEAAQPEAIRPDPTRLSGPRLAAAQPAAAQPAAAQSETAKPDASRRSGPRLDRLDDAAPDLSGRVGDDPAGDDAADDDAADDDAADDDLGWTPPAWLDAVGADLAGTEPADAEAADAEPADAEAADADADAGGSVLDALDLPASQPVSVPGDRLAEAADQLVEAAEPAGLPALSIAVHEEAAGLATLEGVIEAAGHAVAIGASGKDGLRHVRQALAGYVDALIVGLPGGERLIEAALALAPSRPAVIAAVDGPPIDGVRRAAAAGADLALVRPHDASRLAPVLLAAARLVDERRRAATAHGAEQLLRARLDALSEPEVGSLQPYELFHRVLEIELKRARRYNYPISVALFALELPPPSPPAGVRGILRARAGTTLVQTIRDIDLATSLPLDVSRSYDSVPSSDERFLVLLPYTDLGGAAMLARRVIAVVAEGAPVVAGGRTFPPRLIGSVAGAAPGQPLSFSRLMKEATRALEQARRDGAELAVPMPLRGGARDGK